MTGAQEVGLIARLEAATADQQRELLMEAFEAFHPYPGPRHYLVTEIDWSWDRMRDRFILMLDAEAYESAALTLVGGDLIRCEFGANGKGDWWAYLHFVIAREYTGNSEGASTPALAIVIAALRAKGEG